MRKDATIDRLLAVAMLAMLLLYAAAVRAASVDGGASVVATASSVAPAAPLLAQAPDALTPADVSALVAFLCALVAYSLRRWTPPTGWLHSGQALQIVSAAAGALTMLGGYIAEHGVSKRGVVTALVAYGTAAMAQSRPMGRGGSTR